MKNNDKRKGQIFITIPLTKQKLKRHIQKRKRVCSFNVYAFGVLLIFLTIIYMRTNPPEIKSNEISHVEYKPVCRVKRANGKNAPFQALCSDLRLDDPAESYNVSFQFNMPDVKAARKDWQDYAAIAKEANREGPGEQGKPTTNDDETKQQLETQLIKENNFNAYLSEIISVNRSVPNVVPKKCLTKRYLTELPKVSIVISCRNEFHSVLKRTLHSIVNRTPPELLKEIIIVDDHSTRGYSIGEMLNYTEIHFPKLVKFVRLGERKGLMYVRTTGAKIATGDVLVFLDSHIECNHNWLPPLLEPLAINERIVTTPIIDKISHTTFEYQASEGVRGGLDWQLDYLMSSLRKGSHIDQSKPYKDAVMMGGLFAITRSFFWELGGYDTKMDTWGSEQFELSFKIWLCGGMLLVVPCSHVGHIFVVPYDNKVSPKDPSFEQRNKKRVAEVWMDDYKHYVYDTNFDIFSSIDAGDLTEQHALRKRLNCKSFQWFFDYVAPDYRAEHPYDLPRDFANGTLQSLAYPTQCLDTLGRRPVADVGVFVCAENLKHPHLNQLWNLNYRQEMKNFHVNSCLDVFVSEVNAPVKLFQCHHQGGNQFWYYDKIHNWLVHSNMVQKCLELISEDDTFRVVVNDCDETNVKMKWTFGFVNESMIPLTVFKMK